MMPIFFKIVELIEKDMDTGESFERAKERAFLKFEKELEEIHNCELEEES